MMPSAGEKKKLSSEYVGRLGSRKKYCSEIHFSGRSLTGLTSVSTQSLKLLAIAPPRLDTRNAARCNSPLASFRLDRDEWLIQGPTLSRPSGRESAAGSSWSL